MTQVGDLLLTFSSAIDAYKELRTATGGAAGGRGARRGKGLPAPGGGDDLAAAAEPAPISTAPFSVRVLRAVGSGGPVYDWRSNTTASAPSLTVAAANNASVRFTTRYTRSVKSFAPYVVRGAVELRNLDPHGVVIKVGRGGEEAWLVVVLVVAVSLLLLLLKVVAE